MKNEIIDNLNAQIQRFPGSFASEINEDTLCIHQDAYPVDTHLDTISGCRSYGYNFKNGLPDYRELTGFLAFVTRYLFPKGKNKPLSGHMNYSGMVRGGYGAACFSAHAINENLPWKRRADAWTHVADEYIFLADQAEGLGLKMCRSAVQLSDAKNSKELVAIFAAEGAHLLGPDSKTAQVDDIRLQRLSELKNKYGAAYLTLNHYRNTDISEASISLNPWVHPADDGGLSDFGATFVEEILSQGLLVDLCHTNTRGIVEACEIARSKNVPVISTHSGSRSVALAGQKSRASRARRLLEDEAIEAIVKTGGCIGVILCPYYLQGFRYENYARVKDGSIDLVLQHYENLANFMGSVSGVTDPWDHLCFGSDFDGGIAAIPLEMRGGRDLPLLTLRMLERGWPKERIEKVYSGNFIRVWGRAESG